jgi:hypothetical protein
VTGLCFRGESAAMNQSNAVEGIIVFVRCVKGDTGPAERCTQVF